MSGISLNRVNLTLASWDTTLASGEYGQTAVHDFRDSNDGTLPHDAEVVGQIDTGVVANTGTLTIYLVPWARNQANTAWAYAKGQMGGGLVTAGDAELTEGGASADFKIENVDVATVITIDDATNDDNKEFDFSFNVGAVLGGMPEGFSLILTQDTGAALGATSAAHVIEKRFS